MTFCSYHAFGFKIPNKQLTNQTIVESRLKFTIWYVVRDSYEKSMWKINTKRLN